MSAPSRLCVSDVCLFVCVCLCPEFGVWYTMLLLLHLCCVRRVDVYTGRWGGSKARTIKDELRYALAALSGMMVAGASSTIYVMS